jgi:putative endonuclease
MNSWYVYIIEASDKRLYTGITTDISRRWREHCGDDAAKSKGAKFFRGRKPKQLLFAQQVLDRSQASQLEAKIKKQKRSEKLNLISGPQNQINELCLNPKQLNTK